MFNPGSKSAEKRDIEDKPDLNLQGQFAPSSQKEMSCFEDTSPDVTKDTPSNPPPGIEMSSRIAHIKELFRNIHQWSFQRLTAMWAGLRFDHQKVTNLPTLKILNTRAKKTRSYG